MAEATVSPAGKVQSEFFVAVRKRGMLNAMLDVVQEMFERNHPELATKWIYAPPNDNTFVVAREGMGYRLVDASEVKEELTESEAKSGPVRRGDLVLMSCDKEIADEEARQDAQAARDDSKLADTAYREHLKSIGVRLRDGTLYSPQAAGRGVTVGQEVLSNLPEPQHETEK